MTTPPFVVRAPGRVNLIGEHTDYTGGLVLPMAIDRWTVIRGRPLDGRIEATSVSESEPVRFDLPVSDARSVEPRWGRYLAAVAAELPGQRGFSGQVETTIPVGAGLSSSAALEVATALAMGCDVDAGALAQLCRRAEHVATGVPTGIMDQLVIAGAVEGHASMIDCTSLDMRPVRLPEGLAVVVQFVAHRTLEGSEYADRVHECAAAEAAIGPLALASLADVERIGDPLVRRRARHVVSENERVRAFAVALESDDVWRAGEILRDGHRSMAEDFEISVPVMDAAVAAMNAKPGVYGARMTGGGFGGCLVALVDADATDELDGWVVRPVGCAFREDHDG